MTLRRAGLGRIEALVLLALLCGGWLLVVPALFKASEGGSTMRCSNNLRQLGLAAIQYSDDKRFFPHVGPRDALDGGVDSNATTKTVRALVWYGYHDDPEAFVCPQSFDLFVPIKSADVRAKMRLWFWSGAECGDPAKSPFADGLADPSLDATDELSYGWTRRGMSANVRSTALLAADRAQAGPAPGDTTTPGLVGNHAEGANVLQADGTVSWYVAGGDGVARLADLSDGEGGTAGYLAIRTPLFAGDLPARQPRVRGCVGRRPEWSPLPALFGPPAVFGLLLTGLVLRRRPREVAGKVVVPLAPRGPSRVAPLPPDAALQERQRCPLCHDAVVVADALSSCSDCRAVFHADCVPTGGACPTLGCGSSS